MKLRMINSVDELEAFQAADNHYIRWSNSIDQDIERGYSLRCGSSRERGLSAVYCAPVDRSHGWLRGIMEYEFTGARHCYIIRGDQIGFGADGEPLVINPEPVGRLSAAFLRSLRKQQDALRATPCTHRLCNPSDHSALYCPY